MPEHEIWILGIPGMIEKWKESEKISKRTKNERKVQTKSRHKENKKNSTKEVEQYSFFSDEEMKKKM